MRGVGCFMCVCVAGVSHWGPPPPPPAPPSLECPPGLKQSEAITGPEACIPIQYIYKDTFQSVNLTPGMLVMMRVDLINTNCVE